MKTLPVNTGVDSVSPPRAHPSTGSQSGSATPVWTVLIELGGGLPNFSYCLSILDPAVTGEPVSEPARFLTSVAAKAQTRRISI